MAISVAIRRHHPHVTNVLLERRAASPIEPHPELVLTAARAADLATACTVFDLSRDIRAVRLNGRAPLHDAAWSGNDAVVTELLSRGVDVNAQRRTSLQTPLHMAADGGHARAAELLLAAGAETEAADRDGMTPLALADLHSHATVVDLLVREGADPSTAMRHHRTAVHRAAATGTVADVRAALAAGADANARDHWRDTPLHLAVRRDRLPIVRLLVAAGADINALNAGGKTPLVHAACDQMSSHPQTIRYLLGQDGDLNLADCNGWSAVHALAYAGDSDLLKLALLKQPDLERRNDRGETPFLMAAGYLHASCLKVLSEAGADVRARDADGLSAVELVVDATNLHVSDHQIADAIRVLAAIEFADQVES